MLKRFLPLLLTLASFGVVTGCVTGSDRQVTSMGGGELGCKILRVRGCDYVTMYTGSHTLVHAGDCTNPIHQPDTTSHR